MDVNELEASTAQYLTIDELCALTRLSKSTIHRLKAKGQIPFYQPSGKGGKLLFPRDAIERAASSAPLLDQSAEAPCATPAKPPKLSGRPPKWTRPHD